MLSAIAVIPSAPVVVPDLDGGAAAELAELRAAVLRAAAKLPARWVAVGVAAETATVAPDAVGTFAGYGVDVRVGLAPDAAGDPVWLPLAALVTGWVRGAARPEARAQVRVFARETDGDAAVAAGRTLRAELATDPDEIGVLVVADGAHTLTPTAPGGYDPASAAVQDDLDRALARGDAAALARTGGAVVGRVAHQVLAGLLHDHPTPLRELYRDAPYGVGYFVGLSSDVGG